MKGHNICFCSETRKLSLNFSQNPLLSGGLYYIIHAKFHYETFPTFALLDVYSYSVIFKLLND